MQIVDPEFNGLGLGNLTGTTKRRPLELLGKADFVACISVLEHVEDEDAFLCDLNFLLASGGVLFLTVDYDPTGAPEDKFQFHWMRKRIYNQQSLDSLWAKLDRLGLRKFGEVDYTPAPDQANNIPGLGYSFASICMRKE
jgi:SAM-dependent methyltransferase